MRLNSKHGILLKIDKFANGSKCEIPRTFLVIDTNVNTKELKLLNISKIDGKSVSKLLMPSNKTVKKFKPPYMMPSFVKLDELYILKEEDWFRPLANGLPIDSEEFNNILLEYQKYSTNNKVLVVNTTAERTVPIKINQQVKKNII